MVKNNYNKKLNTYLANLAVLNAKVHNIHWNLIGPDFMDCHKMTEEMYIKLNTQYDALAELMKTQGLMPMVKLADYLQETTIDEAEAQEFTAFDAATILIDDLENISNLALEIREAADKDDNFVIVNAMEEYFECYAKYLWILNAIIADIPDEDPEDMEDKD